jgi:hypothetical protein
MRGDVSITARQIIGESGLEGVAALLERSGLAVLVDKRPMRGPLFIIPRDQHREAVDQLLADLKREGARLLLARGGGGVTDGSPAWIAHHDAR